MNQTLSGQEAKQKLLEGIKVINDAVSSTLGPAGRNVLIQNEDGTIRISKDGVTVANSIKEILDPISNMGIQLIKEVANKSGDKVGDGTTTSTLLASVIVSEGIKAITQGSNPVEVKKGIDKAVKLVVDYLRSISKNISGDDQIKQVASLSANNDQEIGGIIAKAIEQSGKDGLVSIEESKNGETELELVQGMTIDRGYRSPYFVTDTPSLQAILPDARVLIYDGIIGSAKDLMPFWEKTAVASDNKPLLVIAHDVQDEALATFILNKGRGTIKGAVVKAPFIDERRTHVLQDIAILTGGTVLSREQGHVLNKFKDAPYRDSIDEVLGTCRMVTVGQNITTLIDGKGDEEKIEKRLYEIKAQIDTAKSNFDKEYLQDRLGKLIGGVAIIHIGGGSEVEMKERKDRVDDALHATKAALQEGILPGGGMALIRARVAVLLNDPLTGDEKVGYDIVLKALKAPFVRILSNAGIEEYSEVLSKIDDGSDTTGWRGYNVKTAQYENFLETGVIDPTKVTRCALENAASVAGTILTTESVIFIERSDEKKDPDEFGGMDFSM